MANRPQPPDMRDLRTTTVWPLSLRSPSPLSTGSADSDEIFLQQDIGAPLTPPPPPSRMMRQYSNLSASARTCRSASGSFIFPITSLPRELRNKIYGYALTSQFNFTYPVTNTNPVKHNIALGLLTTSRQVYEESAPILYSRNRFVFAHPSDCNIFRVVASPKYSELITCVFFRIRERELRLWTTYLGSKLKERSLKVDLPKLKHLWVFLRCGIMALPQPGPQPAIPGYPPAAQYNALHYALGQHIRACRQQFTGEGYHYSTRGVPPPPPQPTIAQYQNQQDVHPNVPPFNQFAAALHIPNQPHYNHQVQHYQPQPPQPPHQPTPPYVVLQPAQNHGQAHNHVQSVMPATAHVHGQPGFHAAPQPFQAQPFQAQIETHYDRHPTIPIRMPDPIPLYFQRWERDLGLDTLCLSLQDTRRSTTAVKIVCILRIPKADVTRLSLAWSLPVDQMGCARTGFRRIVPGVEISLELSGYDIITH